MFVLLTVADFIFMATESAFVDTSSCISAIVEVHPDVLVDFLVVLAMMFGAVAPSSTLGGCLSSWCWSVRQLWRRSVLVATDRRIGVVEYEGL